MRSVLVIVLGLVIIDTVVLVLFSVLADPKSVTTSPDDFDLSTTFITCENSDVVKDAFDVILAAEKLVFVAIGCLFAYFVTKTNIISVHFSKALAFAIYNVGIFTIIMFAILLSLGDKTGRGIDTTVFVFTSLCIICSVVFTVLLLGVHYIMWGNNTDFPEYTNSRTDSSFQMAASIGPTIPDSRDDSQLNVTEDIHTRIQDLKDRLTELQVQMDKAKSGRDKWKKKCEDAEKEGLLKESTTEEGSE
eukprot:CAMPEP_0168531680 /NCGR_PEP_ID=MMETSP0405-20121227/15651_1 /TAXON_ID=498012 /ORGANISM="Trichosphaerium sp, Strain Am-I-7 wt" /LENGTH=246 /DNA_ID=CAMNT_0008556647 /DNA_START=1572 /DNA_END=2312 /DNA_ORIENTATION=-